MSTTASSETKKEEQLRVAFIHPDLGIGGAEQLVVNLALSCQRLGWYVKLFTPSYDPSRSFKEIKDGTLEMEVHGNVFPRLIFGKCHAFCEYMRVFFCALYILFFGGHYDMIVLDQIPFPIPLLNLRFKTFFYCHHPDKVLCVERGGIMKKIYRWVIDTIEEITMSFAHCIVVNSYYTQKVFLENFKLMMKCKKEKPKVIYPCIDLRAYDGNAGIQKKDLLTVKGLEKLKENKVNINKMKVIVSLNRYERKKNLDLAVKSYIDYMLKNGNDYNDSCLIIAGGYDTFLQENIDVFNTLNSYLDTEDKKKMNIFFLRNISNKERSILFRTANIVLYTPKNEHFGIVPVEAMYCGAWVIAHKSGGPMESVVEGKTGNLLDNEGPEKWGQRMKEMIDNESLFNKQDGTNNDKLKAELKKYVEDTFSLKKMEDDMQDSVAQMFPMKKIKNN